MSNNVILLGMMGAGKTTVGKFLAMTLGYTFIDIDKEIELQEGKTIPEIFTENGEEYFRQFEHLVLKNILLGENAVIATGGGIVEEFGNILLLENEKNVFFLDCPSHVLYSRIKGDTNRPNLKSFKEFEELLNSRYDNYKKACSHIINANRTISEIAQEIKGIL